MKRIIVLLGITILLTGCGLIGGDSQEDEVSNDRAGMVDDSFVGSIRDAVGLGSSLECTAIQDGVEQISYIKNDMFRAETKLEDHDGTTIVRDNCVWSWVANEAQGIVMCYEPGEMDVEDEFKDTTIWDSDYEAIPDDVEFSCKRAQLSDDLFEPPSNIEFMNMGSMMEEMIQEGDNSQTLDLGGMMEGLSPEEQEILQEALKQFGGE